MVSPIPFMTTEEFEALNPVINEGWETLAEWTDTTVTFARQDATTDVVRLISIRLAERQEQVAGTGSASTSTELTGTLRAFASEFSRPARQGDRFQWNGHLCIVTAGPFEDRDTAVIHFALVLRNLS